MSSCSQPQRFYFCAAAALVLLSGALAGCATSGPLHAYLTQAKSPANVVAIAARPSTGTEPAATETFPTFLRASQPLLGFGYEPFTDHFYLRLPPGNRIRVVDRPGRRIKREFSIADLPAGGGDLALRPRDRHLFLLHPSLPEIIETTEIGERRRTIPIAGLDTPPVGLAFDPVEQHCHVLLSGTPAVVLTVDLNGAEVSRRTLDQGVAPHGLAFDAEARFYYVLLPDRTTLGRFTLDGHLQGTVATGYTTPVDHFDIGPRSLVRVF